MYRQVIQWQTIVWHNNLFVNNGGNSSFRKTINFEANTQKPFDLWAAMSIKRYFSLSIRGDNAAGKTT